MNIKEKEQIELLSKVIGRRINHENDSYIATRIWDGCCTYLSANRQLFSTQERYSRISCRRSYKSCNNVYQRPT